MFFLCFKVIFQHICKRNVCLSMQYSQFFPPNFYTIFIASHFAIFSDICKRIPVLNFLSQYSKFWRNSWLFSSIFTIFSTIVIHIFLSQFFLKIHTFLTKFAFFTAIFWQILHFNCDLLMKLMFYTAIFWQS